MQTTNAFAESSRVTPRAESTSLIRAGLDALTFGFAIFDRDLHLVASNKAFRALRGYPAELCRPGTALVEFYRFNATRGDYGPGDVEAHAKSRLERVRRRHPHELEHALPSGQILNIRYTPIAHGGTVLAYSDVTARKDAERRAAEKAAQLRIALENMPGALVHTDEDLNIVASSGSFVDVYPVPPALLEPGRPYCDVLRYLAERGYCGAGDVEATVEERLVSLRHPTGRHFEDRTPDGRTYRISRRKIASGGAVTVITDVTEIKETEQRLLAAKQDAERAAALVTEKNHRLQSLSTKLSKYLAPQLYQALFDGEKGVDITSRRKKLTVFFSDIAGFTEITELLESEELTALLNQYLREMSAIAFQYGATVDKFMGDAIMLFFGDMQSRGAREDAIACVEMAIAMQERMKDLQTEWRERGHEQVFRLRIGINTGYCTVGNFGSDNRVDYTVIGKEVNLAARLQAHAEPGGILLAHETYALVKDVIDAEEAVTIPIKGFSTPVRTHRVVGLHGAAGNQGERVIRRESDGVLIIVDPKKLTDGGRADAIRALTEAAAQLAAT
jgi:class 3 adenylate cyclase/PAS domain-containing protein